MLHPGAFAIALASFSQERRILPAEVLAAAVSPFSSLECSWSQASAVSTLPSRLLVNNPHSQALGLVMNK